MGSWRVGVICRSTAVVGTMHNLMLIIDSVCMSYRCPLPHSTRHSRPCCRYVHPSSHSWTLPQTDRQTPTEPPPPPTASLTHSCDPVDICISACRACGASSPTRGPACQVRVSAADRPLAPSHPVWRGPSHVLCMPAVPSGSRTDGTTSRGSSGVERSSCMEVLLVLPEVVPSY